MVVFRARHTTIKLDTATAAAITTAKTLTDATVFTGTSVILANAKNVTISVPEGAVDKIDLIGTTDSFQNQDVDIKPYSMATMSGTLVHSGDAVLEKLAYGPGTAVAATHTRYRFDNGTRPVIAALVTLTDGIDVVSIALDNAYITKLGDMKLSGADGYWEQDFNITCLPRDAHVEYKD